MSRTLCILIGVSVLVTILSVGALIYIFKNGNKELFYGSLFTTVIGLLTVVIAILIYREQQHSQRSFHDEQIRLQKQLRDRVFGIMDGFESVYSSVIRLIEEANKHPDSHLYMMMYWLWFGIDQNLYEDTDRKLDTLLPNDSKVRELLSDRITKGYETTIVVYDPHECDAEIKDFIKFVLEWQIERKYEVRKNKIGEETNRRVIDDNEVNELFKRYEDDFNNLEKRRSETTDTKFQEFRKRHIIPMLMFAMELPHDVKHGFVYLGEKDALKRRAKTCGFKSDESRFVEVLKEQIWKGQNESKPVGSLS